MGMQKPGAVCHREKASKIVGTLTLKDVRHSWNIKQDLTAECLLWEREIQGTGHAQCTKECWEIAPQEIMAASSRSIVRFKSRDWVEFRQSPVKTRRDHLSKFPKAKSGGDEHEGTTRYGQLYRPLNLAYSEK